MACRKRHPDEDFKEYRQRMKNAERNISRHLQGRVVFNSRPFSKELSIGKTYRKLK